MMACADENHRRGIRRQGLAKLKWPRLGERGGAAILVILLLGSGAVLGMGALVVDVGDLYVERELLQTGADAAGMAVASACTQGGCVGTAAVAAQLDRARTYANRSRNAHPGVYAEVTELCGSWDSLPACSTPTNPGGLGRCIGTPAAGTTYLEVRVRTQNAANTSVLPPTFGTALVGGQYRGTAVGACSRYSASATQVVPALWATSTSPFALKLNGANTTVNGLVHSNADVVINGNGDMVSPRVEYVTTYTNGANGASVPAPVRVTASTLAGTVNVADYRPGGVRALAAGANYTAIPASSCPGGASGTWTVQANKVPSGVVYVPCGVKITTAGTVNATIVAEGPIGLFSTGITVNPASPGSVALVSNSNSTTAIDISGGSNDIVNGGIQALLGGVVLETGSDFYKCGVVGSTILVNSNGGTISAGNGCYGSAMGTRLSG
jgi:hypothetical protein